MKILLVPAELIDTVDQLSANTLRRCEEGLIAWRNGSYRYLLLSGCVFLPPFRQTRPASISMREWFIEHGVPKESTLVEVTSVDTYQNIEYSLTLLKERGIVDPHITVLTQYQHALRFMITFWMAHLTRISIIPIRQPAMTWKEWTMEWIMIAYHAIDWFGYLPPATRNRAERIIAA